MSNWYPIHPHEIKKDTKYDGSVYLHVHREGLVLVMVYDQTVSQCSTFLSAVTDFIHHYPQCAVGLIDISQHSSLLSLSAETTNPIQSLPYLCLYWNGLPIGVYHGEPHATQIGEFVRSLYETMRLQANPTKSSSTSKNAIRHVNQKMKDKANYRKITVSNQS